MQKKLKLHFWQFLHNGQRVGGSISVPYNPNKAIKSLIEQSLNKKVKVDKGTITYMSITATPTMTIIKGTMDVENLDKLEASLSGIKLMANGTSVASPYWGYNRTSDGVYEFEIYYDLLPKQLDSLEIVTKEFAGYQLLKEQVSLTPLTNEPLIREGKKKKNVSKTSQGVEITIHTSVNVQLEGVTIETPHRILPKKITSNDN
ncbi:hypothetical protein PMSD_27540 [Paenibacillus macquariensis subsp. defensor]|nr:hypothetical protein PMSD_27540 [Paenibacillus macquariensis subsp. defensor]